MLNKLLKLSKHLPRPGGHAAVGDKDKQEAGFCFKYVVTDFSHANFGFWMNHPRLHDLFALGVLDFAVFDAEAEPGCAGGEHGEHAGNREREGKGNDGPGTPGERMWGSGCLRLELSGEELRPGDLDNPIIVVANYVFDSLKQDAFRCKAIRMTD